MDTRDLRIVLGLADDAGLFDVDLGVRGEAVWAKDRATHR